MKKKIIYLSMFLFLMCVILFSTNSYAATNLTELKNELNGENKEVTLDNKIVIDSTEETLDLKGKTLITNDTIKVEGKGKLTITGNGIVKSNGDKKFSLIEVNKGGTLILENSEYFNYGYGKDAIRILGSDKDDGVKTYVKIGKDATVNANYAVNVMNNEKNTIESYGVVVDCYGKVNGITGNNGYNEGSIALNVNGRIKQTTGNVPVINVYDSTVVEAKSGTTGNLNVDDAVAIYGAGFAKWNIKGGNFTGTTAVSLKSGIFNITGGTFNANGTFVSPAVAYGNGTEATGSAISITSNSGYASNIEVYIDNAKFVSKNGYALSEYITKGTTSLVNKLNVTSGTFTGKEGAVYSQNLNSFIESGKYSSDVSKFIKKGLVCKEVNGVFLTGKEYTVDVDKLENGTVTLSKTKALAKEEVAVTIKANNGYLLNTLKVLDGNNKEIKVTNGKFVMPNSNVTVTADFIKATVKIELPKLDTKADVDTPTVGIISEEKAQNILLESLSQNEELKSQVEGLNTKIELDVEEITIEDELKSKIEDEANKNSKDIKVATYFNIDILVKNADTNAEIGKITELTDKITITILLPENLRGTENGYTREYYIVREHNGETELIKAKVSEDGNYITFETDRFSTYALAYKDVKVEAENVKNPSTGDYIVSYVTLLVVSAIGIAFVILNKKKAMNK